MVSESSIRGSALSVVSPLGAVEHIAYLVKIGPNADLIRVHSIDHREFSFLPHRVRVDYARATFLYRRILGDRL